MISYPDATRCNAMQSLWSRTCMSELALELEQQCGSECVWYPEEGPRRWFRRRVEVWSEWLVGRGAAKRSRPLKMRCVPGFVEIGGLLRLHLRRRANATQSRTAIAVTARLHVLRRFGGSASSLDCLYQSIRLGVIISILTIVCDPFNRRYLLLSHSLTAPYPLLLLAAAPEPARCPRIFRPSTMTFLPLHQPRCDSGSVRL